MSSTTENLGLALPDVTDFYDVGVTNTNMSLIDAAVGQIADTGAKETSVQSIITSVGTTTDTGGTATTGTVMGKLNAIQTFVDDSVSQEYATTHTSGIPTLSTPLTTTITGSGRLFGLYADLYPNYTSTSSLNKLVLIVSVDNETILSHTTYRTSTSTYGAISYILFGTTDVVSYGRSTFDFTLLPVGQSSGRNKGNAQVYGEATTALLQSDISQRRVSLLTNPIKFSQNVTITISAEDYDNTMHCTIDGVYILD